MKVVLNKIIFVFTILLFSQTLFSQNGNYIKTHWIYQYSNMSNRNDFFNRNLSFENTYRSAYGFSYVLNSTDIFGIEVGFKYSKLGQKYSGSIDDDFNTKDTTDPLDFSSEIELSYIQIPFLFCFNSRLEDENVYLTISGGLQLDILVDAKMNIDPYPDIPADKIIDIKNLFRKTNASFVTNAIFNIKIFENIFINTGFQMIRTIGDVENKNFVFDSNKHPVEYYFPVSVKKDYLPDISKRDATKHTNYGFILGVSYMFKEIK